MNVIQALILGTIQGLTEFLPISSSGHLIFIPKLFGWGDQGLAFDTMMHLGTLLAVVVYFRKKLWSILLGLINTSLSHESLVTVNSDRKLGWLLILSIIPAGVVGLFFGDWIETNLRTTLVIGVGLIFWGVILFIADRVSLKHENTKALERVSWKETLFIGCAQVVAFIPGTSRSGITMTAGLFSKLDKKTAAEFSFLMSVPIIALAGGLQLLKMITHGFETIGAIPLIVGFIASALSGLIAIAGLMKVIQKWSFTPFVVYRVVVGVLILVFLV